MDNDQPKELSMSELAELFAEKAYSSTYGEALARRFEAKLKEESNPEVQPEAPSQEEALLTYNL